MNLLYLIHVLSLDNSAKAKLSEVVAAIDLPPLDMNLAIWGALDRGEIEIDEKKDKITPLVTYERWHDTPLAKKLLEVVSHYAANGTNITVGRMNSYIKDPVTHRGYPFHEYLMTMQYLIETNQVLEQVVSVPEIKNKRPFHRFVFLCLPENEAKNEEMNSKAINKWIAEFEKNKVK
jgi:hypothetical protein